MNLLDGILKELSDLDKYEFINNDKHTAIALISANVKRPQDIPVYCEILEKELEQSYIERLNELYSIKKLNKYFAKDL